MFLLYCWFGSKSINFLILTKFSLYSFSKVLISNLTFALSRLHEPIHCLYVSTYLESLYYGLNCYFSRVLLADMIKKIEAYFEPHNFKILRNKMKEKAGLEIILKKCEHVTYVKERTISMITISVITNQNWINEYLFCYSLF